MIRVKVSTMRFIALLFRLTIILAQFSEAEEYDDFYYYNANSWFFIDRECERSIPVEISVEYFKNPELDPKIIVRSKSITDNPQEAVDYCTRFSETFLHKATLLQYVFRQYTSLEPVEFVHCEKHCKHFLPNDPMDGSIRIKHIADCCNHNMVFVIPNEDFEKMTKEEMLERKVNYTTELLSSKQLYKFTEKQEWHHLEAYLELFDDDKLRGEVEKKCQTVYKAVGDGIFNDHSVNDDYKDGNKLTLIVSLSVGGFILIISCTGAACYYSKKKYGPTDDVDK